MSSRVYLKEKSFFEELAKEKESIKMKSPFINPEKLEKRLENENNFVIKHQIKGQGNRHLDEVSGKRGNLTRSPHKISDDFKALIGSLAKVDGNKSVAKEFNLYPQQVSNYRNSVKPDGLGNLIPDETVREKSEKIEDKIRDTVHSKVSKLINSISDEEIDSCGSIQTKAKTASSLAGIIDKIGNKNDSEKEQRRFVFIGVPIKTEEEYSVIDISAKVLS